MKDERILELVKLVFSLQVNALQLRNGRQQLQ